MRGGWDVALEEQQRLAESLRRPVGAGYMERFAEVIAEKAYDPVTGEVCEQNLPRSRSLVFGAGNSAEHGIPAWVNCDVLDIVDAASESFKLEPLYLDDLFVPSAFAYFERPMIVQDAKGKDMAIRAVSWMLTSPYDRKQREVEGKTLGEDLGLMVAHWCDCDDEDEFNDEAIKLAAKMAGSKLSLAHVDEIRFGATDWLRGLDGNPDPRAGTTRDFMLRMQVLWRLAQQQIAMPGLERVARPTWRRASNWRQIKEVVVLKLRKARPHEYEGGEREVEWSHRWMVSGHWRSQPYKISGETVYRQIWIAPYVKGPDGKPLVLKRHAVEFVR